MRRTLLVGLTVALLGLLTAAEARAWGALHVGFTHYGPMGLTHYGRTAAVGPYGAYSGGHAGFYGAGGSTYRAGYGGAVGYGGGYAAGGYRSYASPYGGYYGGGFRTAGIGGVGGLYDAGVYRRW